MRKNKKGNYDVLGGASPPPYAAISVAAMHEDIHEMYIIFGLKCAFADILIGQLQNILVALDNIIDIFQPDMF